ncbi:MAG: hypothetical protein Q9162_005312 [Coniocarpon cinnabarinum]
MYINQIIIQGFKSYKDQTILEPFSPKHNVIVGRNGSGKSNFFAAIRFALGDSYTSLSREDRQNLLHEGSGSAVMSAYVEVIFDNSDERFPTGKDELILRRTIGQKKDEYSLDRKNATKQDVMNLLESAGFSKSNPYYIVPQGRVTTLTNMKDPERLNLLKEVAGTQVYENRRAESLKIMNETDSKRAKIDELLTTIRGRLEELEEEKEELRAYQDKDRERRCLEYTIYNREQEEINRALEEIDNLRVNGVDENDANRDRFQQGEQDKQQLEEEIGRIRQRLELLGLDRKQHQDEKKDAAKQKANIELEVQNLSAGQSAAQQSRTQFEQDLQHVQSTIGERESALQKLMPEYNKIREQEKSIKSQVMDTKAKQQRLSTKEGRNARFKTKNERDKWLQKEIDENNTALATRKAVRTQTIEDIQALESDIKKAVNEISSLREEFEHRGETMQKHYNSVQKAKENRNALQDQRKEFWREEARLDTVLRNTQQEYKIAEDFLNRMMDRNTSRGLAAVRRIKQEHNLDGVYGPLAELFTVSDKFKTSVEVTGGTSLFHVVVDNDETATQVLEILQKERAGRVTFMPLNRLNPKQADLPQANDAIAMISRLNFEAKYEKAFRQVFGKTIICPNLEVAAQYARSHSVSAITPDGDRSDKKGALSGGYHDPRSSRIDGVHNLVKHRDELDKQRGRLNDIRQQLTSKDQEITRAVGEFEKAEQRARQAERGYEPKQQEMRARESDLQNKNNALDSKRLAKEKVEDLYRETEDQQSAYEAELASDFKKALSNAEEAELQRLNDLLPKLNKQHLEISSKRADLESQKSNMDVELRENLRPRLAQLKTQGFEFEGGSGTSNALQARQKDLKKITKSVDTIDARLLEVEQSIEAANEELATVQRQRDDKQRELEELARGIERFQKKMDKSIAKKTLLSEKATEAAHNIRDLGVLPEEAFESKYTRVSSDKAIKRLHAVHEALKKYSHVNKKAFEQYTNFTRQRTELQKRRKELDDSQGSITDLINVLDQRKDEAIERTFKQVSKEFATVFQKLVPAGKGRLIIQRKADPRSAQADEDESDTDAERRRASSVENYTGVGIAVSFNSTHDEQQHIQQLSGGQKSLCALALVFAIQACDPAPFYLFDEIDANLDAQYRTAVAELLKESSKTGQFICTTFRAEMLHVAEKCYGVVYRGNKTSEIVDVSRETALEFVEGRISGQ